MSDPKPSNESQNIPSKLIFTQPFSPEILLPLGNLRIKTNNSNNNTNSMGLTKKESEDNDEIEQSYSPSKYFCKRPSFEFRNLKNIEKPLLNRQYSEFKFKESKNLENEKKIKEDIKVRFVGEEIIEDDLDSKSFDKKKFAKSILKKAHFLDEVPIEKIFDKEINFNIIEKIQLQSRETNRSFKEFLAKEFVEYWKTVEKNDELAIRFLKVEGFFCGKIKYF